MKTSVLFRNTFFIPLILLLVFANSCRNTGDNLRVEDLRCEYLVDPMGVDVPHPRFSWKITGERRGVRQTAYRITVKSAAGEKVVVWDSGRKLSGRTTNIVYQGKPLKSSEKYLWRVEIWDERGHKSSPTQDAWFVTGLFHRPDWQAGWIMSPDTTVSAPLFRKEFAVDKTVDHAWVYVTGLGNYELYLNGKKVGDHVLDPARTDFRKRVLYAAYDVTELLQTGANAVGIMLGNGTYRVVAVAGRYGWRGHKPRTNNPRTLMQLEITYTDGSKKTIVTGPSWKVAAGPIVFNNVYGGEDYDARLEQTGWTSPGFDDSRWHRAVATGVPGVVLRAQLMPPMKVTRTIQPVAVIRPAPGVTLYDLGQSFAGWWRIRVKGQAGVTLRIRGAETLNDSLFPKPLEPGDTLSTKFNYHARVWTTYTLKGGAVESYEPRFFYTGFRYVEVSTAGPDQIDSLAVEGRVVHTDLENAGTFASSDTLLNRIWRAARWSQKGNQHGVPTDCPHREKGAYTGDGEVIAESSIHDFNMAAFYTKWLNDMRDSQEKSGRIPNTAPTLIGGYGGGVAWGSAYILIPWWMYQYYTDSTVMANHYPTMKRYLDYLHRLARTDAHPEEPYIINDFGSYWLSLGEWCAPGESDGPDHPVVSTAYYYLDALTLSKIAKVLDRQEDAAEYAALADTIKEAFNKKFFDPATGLYGTDTLYQTYQVLALALDLVPGQYRERVLNDLVTDIMNKHQGHLYTGIIGTKYLWRVLARSGHGDVAFTVVTRTTYPGYGFWLSRNATTLWEKWGGEHSHNHQMFGTVQEFLYKYLAGIRSPEDGGTTTGYRHIHIQPYIPAGLSFAGASVNTVRGKVVSRWEQKDGKIRLHVEIPANADASVSLPLPAGKNVTVTESGKTVWAKGAFVHGVAGISGARAEKGHITLSLSSGNYDLLLSGK